MVGTNRTEQGQIPTVNQGLEALAGRTSIAPIPRKFPQDPYLNRTPADGWGNPFIYLVPGTGGRSYEIISYGRDGEPGGEGEDADISSLQL